CLCPETGHTFGRHALLTGRRKDAQPVSVRVQADEGAAEIHVGRLLQDGDAALLPLGEGRVESGWLAREGEPGAAARARGARSGWAPRSYAISAFSRSG